MAMCNIDFTEYKLKKSTKALFYAVTNKFVNMFQNNPYK